jgi:predicted glycogen debranching enzyme
MEETILRVPIAASDPNRADPLLSREWLVANGLGGYASGTLAGVASRRYHSLLIAALPGTLGRRVMLNHLTELLRLPSGETVMLGGKEHPTSLELYGADLLKEFRLELGLPVWRYEFHGCTLEKRVVLPHQQNAVHVQYRLLDCSGPVRLKLRPSLHFRGNEEPISGSTTEPCPIKWSEGNIEIIPPKPLPPLRMMVLGEKVAFTLDSTLIPDVMYRVEESRGYHSIGNLWSPGYFRADLSADHPVTLVASTDSWETIGAVCPEDVLSIERRRRQKLLQIANPAVREEPISELVLAADQFLITPHGRPEDAARAHAAGDEVRTVIAGYHWFTDWGRDTMISLEGLTLITGRPTEAGYILRTFSEYIRDGLIPNLFPEGQHDGLYHTADATLWYFHAIHRYVIATGDRVTLRQLLPKLRDIVAHHVRGTRFGIGVDPVDGLLRQGEEGYQLTWMDAKVGDWVVTPRRGKAVEINGLWYNALKLLEGWEREEFGPEAGCDLAELAERCRVSFNRRFWYEKGGYCYDVVDSEGKDDASLRPNQLMAFSLQHPVLCTTKWKAVLDVCREQLLTPVGLRSLAPGDPNYKSRYFGDLRARDAAYHQGTVWAWLMGPFIDAYLATYPDQRTQARQFLDRMIAHLSEAGVGSISEIFDAEAPFTPRGCISQAWSVAEMLRCWVRTSA